MDDTSDKKAEERENIKKTLELMDDIYKVVKDERFHKEFTAEQRHKILLEKYKDIANMYPVVLRIMARDLRYNRVALRRMLEKLLKDQEINALENAKRRESGKQKQDPLAAMRSFITHQADYAKFLYIEETKKAGRHLNMKNAKKIWNIEYDNMNRALKKIKEDEDRARNEFEDEKKKHLDQRRKELLDFVTELNNNADNADNTDNTDIVDDADTTSSSASSASSASVAPTEEDIRESELAELEELDNYIQDLNEAHTSFLEGSDDDNIMHGMSNEDMHEYDQHLTYCRHLFDLAVKYEKMDEATCAELTAKIEGCTTCLETEAQRRHRLAEQERRAAQDEWIAHLKPKPHTRARQGKRTARR
jgi:hypothetical protein